MPFARLSLSAIAVAGLSLALSGTPAQAQYADDPPYGYDHPAPGYSPPSPGYAQPGYAQPGYAQPGYAQPGYAQPGYAPPADDGYAPPPAYAGPPPRYADSESTVGEVIIVAPYRHSERDPATGAPIERVSTSRRVRYDDLDLTTDWGVHELHHRVERAAQDACDSLDRHFDTLDSGDQECVVRAIRDAMAQAPIGYASDAAYEGR